VPVRGGLAIWATALLQRAKPTQMTKATRLHNSPPASTAHIASRRFGLGLPQTILLTTMATMDESKVRNKNKSSSGNERGRGFCLLPLAREASSTITVLPP